MIPLVLMAGAGALGAYVLKQVLDSEEEKKTPRRRASGGRKQGKGTQPYNVFKRIIEQEGLSLLPERHKAQDLDEMQALLHQARQSAFASKQKLPAYEMKRRESIELLRRDVERRLALLASRADPSEGHEGEDGG